MICRNIIIEAVDIDEAMLDIATKYFGLKLHDNLIVHIMDGLKYLENINKMHKKYEAILFDVDSKDPSLGMSCPPKNFVTSEVLENVKNCVHENGKFFIFISLQTLLTIWILLL